MINPYQPPEKVNTNSSNQSWFENLLDKILVENPSSLHLFLFDLFIRLFVSASLVFYVIYILAMIDCFIGFPILHWLLDEK